MTDPVIHLSDCRGHRETVGSYTEGQSRCLVTDQGIPTTMVNLRKYAPELAPMIGEPYEGGTYTLANLWEFWLSGVNTREGVLLTQDGVPAGWAGIWERR